MLDQLNGNSSNYSGNFQEKTSDSQLPFQDLDIKTRIACYILQLQALEKENT
jgi:hypothetical protein